MEIHSETGAASRNGLSVGEPGGPVPGPEINRKELVYDLNEEGGGDDNTVVVVNRRVVTETTVEMRHVGYDDNGSVNVVGENNTSSVSAEKSEFNGNGISLVVDVHGSLNGVKESDTKDKRGTLDGGFSYAETAPGVHENRGNDGVIDDLEKAHKDLTIEDGEDDGEIVGDENHDFMVGDFVWGKIKSHPWWPGQIYDSSDASEFASKFKHRDRVLVAYFGDGSCAWCSSSQLVPFTEHFEEMSKQSVSKSLDNAVKKALEEIGRHVELKMICSCVPVGNRAGLARPHAVNAGVKPGVLVPEGDIGRLATPKYEPAEVLEYLRHVGQTVSVTNMLELVIVKSWLSAFYRVGTGCKLPTFHEPQQIEGLEDKSENGVSDTDEFRDPIEVPIRDAFKEDRFSLQKAGPGKGPMLSDEKLNQHRKQKSVAELMGEDTGVKPKSQRRSKNKEGTPSTMVKKNKKAETGDVIDIMNLQASTPGRRRGRKRVTEMSISPGSAADEGVHLEEKASEIPMTSMRRKNEDSGVDVESEKSVMLRERKKSKYLSPPYTSHSWRVGKQNAKAGLETESEKISKIAGVGERMTRASGQLFASPPISKCNSETSKVAMVEERSSRKSGRSPQIVKQKEKKIIDSMDTSASMSAVLAELHSAGINLMSLEDGSIETIKRFVTAFRSSMYSDGSNNKGSRKRKLPVPKSREVNQADTTSPQPPTHSETTERPRSRVTKLKKNARAAATNKMGLDKKASPVSLIVSFAPDTSLPSKDAIIKLFSNYGKVNEDETEVLFDSNCAQVAFMNISDAEAAFKESIKESPFGANSAVYRLRYSSAAARALDSGQKILASPKKRARKSSIGSQPTDDRISQVGPIKQNLETLRSMLDMCKGKISSEERSSLEGEIRSLAEKASVLAVKTSS